MANNSMLLFVKESNLEQGKQGETNMKRNISEWPYELSLEKRLEKGASQ